jgi:inorganic pyrophosphatase
MLYYRGGDGYAIMNNSTFWHALDILVDTSTLTIDRPKGSAHPRYADFRYPLDYGYLEGTTSGDSLGIDIWWEACWKSA